ncbi:MAG: MBL fold metallo-hydrolase [Clostridium sp.]|uniref:MBL fold metallo-hydrolase n=1 Tax=Clostridium sp. TaxID=1506 RepID=UPI00290CA834|nr:MBL fold metallo-hydrolase [Clostridium sp.]MDU7336683.1 MBL fold metallo-hydrolase [Clostridium sp.]
MSSITMLTIHAQFRGVTETIHPVVLQDESHLVLIDCGYVGFLPQIEQALTENGFSAANLTHVFITHQDHDHMGALADLIKKYPHIKVVTSRREAPYISGAEKSLRLTQAEEMQEKLPPEQQEFGKAFCALLERVQAVPVDVEVSDGEELNWCGGCTVIATPGHTPGHTSLYLKQFQTIITGDAVALENGVPVIANPQFALDLAQAEKSMQMLFSYGAKEWICYHGGRWIASLQNEAESDKFFIK